MPAVHAPSSATPAAPPPAPAATSQQHEQSALERELAAGREVRRVLTPADKEQQQRVEANIRHVLRQVGRLGGCIYTFCNGHGLVAWERAGAAELLFQGGRGRRRRPALRRAGCR